MHNSIEHTTKANVSNRRSTHVSLCLGANSSSTASYPTLKKANAFSTPCWIGLCGSRGMSQCLWWHRCWDAHQIGPPWFAAHPTIFKKRRVVGPHLNAAWEAYRWRHTDMQMPILQIAMKNDSAMVTRTTSQFVSKVTGTMSNDVRYKGTGTKQKKVRIPTMADRTICIPNAAANICVGV